MPVPSGIADGGSAVPLLGPSRLLEHDINVRRTR